jgi:hypothetical protein
LVFNGAKITIMVKQQQAPEYQDSWNKTKWYFCILNNFLNFLEDF